MSEGGKIDLGLFRISERSALILTSIVLLIVMHDHLSIYYEDDSWTTSVVYNYYVKGLHLDVVFLDNDGSSNYQYFGYLYANVLGFFLQLFGWVKSNVYLFNTLLLIPLFAVWKMIAKAMPLRSSYDKIFPYYFILFPPVLFASHTGRVDVFCFLLVSACVLSFLKRQYFLTGLLAVLSVEVHVMGLIGIFYCLNHEIRVPSFRRNKMWFNGLAMLGGLLLGCGVYLFLHHHAFSLNGLVNLIGSNRNMVSPLNNYVMTYFTDFDWYLHIPEFLLMLGSVVLYARLGSIDKKTYAVSLVFLLIVSTLLTRRENRNYFLYISPAILIFYFHVFSKRAKLHVLKVSLFCISIFYCLILKLEHYKYDFGERVSWIRTQIVDNDMKVVGMPDIWFATYDKNYVAIHNQKKLSLEDTDDFYFVSTDYLSHRSRVYDDAKTYLLNNYNCECVDSISSTKYPLKFLKCQDDGVKNEPLVYKPYPGWKKVVSRFMEVKSSEL